MLPVIFGAMGLYALSKASSRKSPESFGHHLPPSSGFRSIGLRADGWDLYEFNGKNGSLLVAMYPDPAGAYPYPGRTSIDYAYPSGDAASVVRARGPRGQKWDSLDISSPQMADLLVFHPHRRPPELSESSKEGQLSQLMSFGAVSPKLGGRGPTAGQGVSSSAGGRQVGTPYDWSGPTSSGGFRRWRHPDEDLQVPGESMSDRGPVFGDLEDERFGFNLLGMSIPTSKEERVDSLEGKIERAKEKLDDLEKAAKQPGADLERISKQIASIQTQMEKWEDRKNKIEMRMGEDDAFGGTLDLMQLDDSDADLDLYDDEDEEFGFEDDEDFGSDEESDDEVFGATGVQTLSSAALAQPGSWTRRNVLASGAKDAWSRRVAGTETEADYAVLRAARPGIASSASGPISPAWSRSPWPGEPEEGIDSDGIADAVLADMGL